jgi:hypothetical protein
MVLEQNINTSTSTPHSSSGILHTSILIPLLQSPSCCRCYRHGTTWSGQAWCGLCGHAGWRKQAAEQIGSAYSASSRHWIIQIHIDFALRQDLTLSWPKSGSLVMWDRKTLSEYIDLKPPGLDAPMPAPTDVMEVPLPSDSYLFEKIWSWSTMKIV